MINGTITEINGKKVKIIINRELKEFEMQPWVENFAKLGDCDIDIQENKVNFLTMKVNKPKHKEPSNEEIAANKTGSTKSKDSDVIDIKGKNYMTYQGLLKKAHEKTGGFSMEITDSWVNEDMTMAWCKVRLSSNEGNFDGFGSSTPDNTGQMTQTHPVEMCHTRAKGRALRDYLNIGEVMAEELK